MATAPDPSRHLWFLDTEVTIKISVEDGHDGLCVMQHRAAAGDSPPLHIHQDQDEIFHILEGRLLFRVADALTSAGTGDTVAVPKGLPHTYRVDAAEGAGWLTILRGGDFEGLVREIGRPAERHGLPDPSGEPTPEQVQDLTAACLRHGIEIVGPPLH